MKRLLLFVLLSGLLASAQQVVLQNPGLSGSFQISSGVASDTTPPVVAITSPTGGTVSGVVTVSVTATDNVGVTSVQLWVGGANSGLTPGVSGSTYTFSWNTTYLTNGSYNLQAIAYDAASNKGMSSTITVTTSNVVAACGPPNYDCFNSTTTPINYSVPGPNWGPNTCDWTSPYTVQNCGNLTGANVCVTPADFGSTECRITDASTVAGSPQWIWTTYDSPSVAAWNTDDTGMLLKVTGSGAQYFMGFNPSTLTAALVNNAGVPVTFQGNAWFSGSVNNVVYWYDGTNQTQLKQSTVTLSTGVVNTTVLFDFNKDTCLANPINGVPGGFPQSASLWTGTAASSFDDSTFARGFSTLAAQGTGIYEASWTVGQAGCDLWNTATNVITHNGVLVGTVSDAPWGGANGGKFDKYKQHDVVQTPDPNWVMSTASPNTMIYGSYNDGNYFWQKGTTNVQRCGIGAPNWTAANAQLDGNRVNPTAGNAGDYIYQIVNGVAGTTGATAPTWNQTVGSDTSDNGLTWHNVGLGGNYPTGAQYFCDGHGYQGSKGLYPGKHLTEHDYNNPINPETKILNYASSGDQHFSNNNGNMTDSNWFFAMSADVGTGVNLLDTTTPYPSALYNEVYLLAPPYLATGAANCTYDATTCPHGVGAVRRGGHTFNSGWHQVFDVQNNMCVISQTGNFALCSTDGMGQFGNISGAASCNVGAPDWTKEATTDGTTPFNIGYKVFPNPTLGGNNGNYIYSIQSCAGTCTTGATKPAWTQTNGATVADTACDGKGQNCGTITWVNTGLQQNCRADDIVIKLYR